MPVSSLHLTSTYRNNPLYTVPFQLPIISTTIQRVLDSIRHWHALSSWTHFYPFGVHGNYTWVYTNLEQSAPRYVLDHANATRGMFSILVSAVPTNGFRCHGPRIDSASYFRSRLVYGRKVACAGSMDTIVGTVNT